MNTLSLCKLQISCKVLKNCMLPSYLGNTIRGSFGNSLVKHFCTHGTPGCQNCAEVLACPYSFVFKSAARHFGMNQVPNPFTIDVPDRKTSCFQAGDYFDFSMTLFGSACQYKEAVLFALLHLFDSAFGNVDQAAVIYSIKDAYSQANLYSDGDMIGLPESFLWDDQLEEPVQQIRKLKIDFVSPLQILKSKKLLSSIDFRLLMDSVFNRIADVIDVYADHPFVLPYNLFAKHPHIVVKQDLQMSAVRQKDHTFTGIKGSINLEGDMTRYMPYIGLGSQLHIGKLATRGFGQFVFEIIPE